MLEKTFATIDMIRKLSSRRPNLFSQFCGDAYCERSVVLDYACAIIVIQACMPRAYLVGCGTTWLFLSLHFQLLDVYSCRKVADDSFSAF